MPAEAQSRTEAGLRAFAVHWLAAADYLARTGDAGPLRRASLPTCLWCEDLAILYTDMYREGGLLIGDVHSTISTFQLAGLSGPDRGSVQFRAQTPKHIEFLAATASPRQNEAATLDYTLNVAYAGGHWKVEKAAWKSV